MEILGKSSMVSYDLFCPVNEFLRIRIRSMAQSWNGLWYISVSSPRVSLSFSLPSQMFLLCFLLAQFPLSTPQPSPLVCPCLCCCSSLSDVAVPELSFFPDLPISLLCSGAAAELGVQGKGVQGKGIALSVAVREAVM